MPEFNEYKSDAAVVADLAAKQNHLHAGHLTKNQALVSPEARIVDLEQYYGGRDRKRGTFVTSDINSFVAYTHSEALPENVRVFIDRDVMQAEAVLNFEQDDYEQGHLDHQAVLKAERTAAFAKLASLHGYGRTDQKSFACFLEDWGHKVIAHDAEGNVIDNAKAVNAVRNMTIDETAQTNSHVGNFRESKSRLEAVEAKSIGGSLPAYFEVRDECYHGLQERTLKLRLAIGNDDGKPTFMIEVVGWAVVKDELAKEFAELVAAKLGDSVIVLVGKFKG